MSTSATNARMLKARSFDDAERVKPGSTDFAKESTTSDSSGNAPKNNGTSSDTKA